MAAPMIPMTPALRQLAAGDFSALVQRFGLAGFNVARPAAGIVTISARQDTCAVARASVLLSVGVHGDETGPIDMLAGLLDALSLQPSSLAVDLMVCVGNIDAIAAGKRFSGADLNRMFGARRGALGAAAEAARADAMMDATTRFFAGAGAGAGAGGARWHLDLHTAIRPSEYPTFAVVPDLIAAAPKTALVGWLGQAAIGAIIMNPQSAGTYSYYSAEQHGAAAATVELGQVGALGQNDLSLLAGSADALGALLRGVHAGAGSQPQVFRVAQEIIKLSDDFAMAFGRDTRTFTALPAGAVIATDGATVYRVGHAEERVVFPNPDVRIGLRAGLMVVRA